MISMPKVLTKPQTASEEAKIQLWLDFKIVWYFPVAIEILKFILGSNLSWDLQNAQLTISEWALEQKNVDEASTIRP